MTEKQRIRKRVFAKNRCTWSILDQKQVHSKTKCKTHPTSHHAIGWSKCKTTMYTIGVYASGSAKKKNQKQLKTTHNKEPYSVVPVPSSLKNRYDVDSANHHVGGSCGMFFTWFEYMYLFWSENGPGIPLFGYWLPLIKISVQSKGGIHVLIIYLVYYSCML